MSALPPRRPVRLATRHSPLALWQARRVAERLRAAHPGLAVELVEVTSRGDRDLQPFAVFFAGGPKEGAVGAAAPGSVGLFTRQLDEALLAGEADIAVHSLKDYPTSVPAGLSLDCIPERAAVRDVLVVPSGAREGATAAASPGPAAWLAALVASGGAPAPVGTGSPRRAEQLRALVPRLRIEAVRGNVGTRLRKLIAGDFAALVMAEAGLTRLAPDTCPELAEVSLLPFDPESELVPAPGQGALAVARRADDAEMRDLLEPLHDVVAAVEVIAERALLAALGGGCFVPVGALGRVARGEEGTPSALRLHGRIAAAGAGGHVDVVERLLSFAWPAAADGSAPPRRLLEACAADIGEVVAGYLLDAGARVLIDRLRGSAPAPTATAGQGAPDSRLDPPDAGSPARPS